MAEPRGIAWLESLDVPDNAPALQLATLVPAAERHGIDPVLMRAVVMKESSGRTASADYKPGVQKVTVNYEAHWFSRLTGHAYDKTYPSISQRKWRMPRRGEDHAYNCSQVERWGLIFMAAGLDFEAGLCASSYGLFQIMGFNYGLCGCDSVEDFLAEMHMGGQRQFQLWLTFIKNYDCLEPLQRGDLLAFAIRYNTGRNWRDPQEYENPSVSARKYAVACDDFVRAMRARQGMT